MMERYIGLAALEGKARRALVHATLRSGVHLLAEIAPETPVDTGELRGSEHLSDIDLRGDRVELKVVAAAPHAIYVHERDELQHAVGQAHFVEEPLVRNRRRYLDDIRDAARREF
jgi:hypothetical protein